MRVSAGVERDSKMHASIKLIVSAYMRNGMELCEVSVAAGKTMSLWQCLLNVSTLDPSISISQSLALVL